MEHDTTTEEKHHYDKEKEYDTVIMPLLELVRALCIKHDLPFVFGTVVKRNEDGFVVATVAQKCKDGWAPHELVLARSMMLGNMQLVGGGISKKDIFDAMIDHLTKQHDVNLNEEEKKDGN